MRLNCEIPVPTALRRALASARVAIPSVFCDTRRHTSCPALGERAPLPEAPAAGRR